jgi:prefoldin subunit 5
MPPRKYMTNVKPGTTSVTVPNMPAARTEDRWPALSKQLQELQESNETFTATITRIAMTQTSKLEQINETVRQLIEGEERHAESDRLQFKEVESKLGGMRERVAELEKVAAESNERVAKLERQMDAVASGGRHE